MFDRNTSGKNYYEILEIPQNATHEEVKKAYHKLALKYHPDKASLTNISPERAEILFKEIGSAFGILSDPSKRRYYDLSLNTKTPINNFNFHNSWEDRNYRTGFSQFKKRNTEGFDFDSTWHSFNSSAYTSRFWEHEKNSNESTLPEPTAENRKEINDLIINDEAKQLDSYLNKHNFGSQSLLKELLSFAAQHGSFKVVKYLVEERKMNPRLIVTSSSFFQGSIFKYAAESGNLDLVKYLLEEHNADIESQATTYPGCCGTALSYAAEKGHVHIVEYLIKKGANVNPEVAYSDILNKAIDSGNLSIVKLLIEAGTKLGKYHLDRSFEKGNIEIAQYILQIRPGIANHHFLNSTPAASTIQSGNLILLKYLEQYEKLDIFAKYGNNHIENMNTYLLSAAARSGNIDMMRYLLEEKGLLSECQKPETANKHIQAILIDAVKEDGFHTKKVDVQQRLHMVRYLMQDKKFILPTQQLFHVIQEGAQFSSIEMNAYLQSYLPDLENHRDMLLAVASHGLAKLSIEELFRLYNLNIIQKGKYGNFEDNIHHHIQSRNISNVELRSLIPKYNQFKTDALFYYSNYRCENDLSQLQIIIESGIDINIENIHGNTAVQYAFNQGGYNEIVKFLIEKGADVYKCWPPGKSVDAGKSLYDMLETNKEFQDQLERVSKRNAEHHTDSQSSYTSYKR